MIISVTPGSAAHEFACHSKACAPPPAGHGGSDRGGKHITHPVRKHSTPNFIDANPVRHIKSIDDWTKRGVVGNRHPTGVTGHTKAFIDRVLGVEKYPKRSRAQKVLTRAEARAKGAFS